MERVRPTVLSKPFKVEELERLIQERLHNLS